MSDDHKIILVTGGARSGKSSFSEQKTLSLGYNPFYIATCPVIDNEMQERIYRHQKVRENANWQTIEEEIDLVSAIKTAKKNSGDTILIDCLTLWINNLLYRNENLSEDDIIIKSKELINAINQAKINTVLVINEVGLGLVPESKLARKFRDISGRCSQEIARYSDEVYLIVAGQKLQIK